MGLYGERIGALHIVCNDVETAKKVESQIKLIVRANYSSPPIHGARLAGMILDDKEMRQQWLDELVMVTDRITAMRDLLKEKLTTVRAKSSTGNWEHITTQIGMFSFTGLTTAQSEAMVEKYHIYMTSYGRISIAGITVANVDYVA
jgi:aspartate/tyrosine/aromatic aminotransferase